MPVSGLYAAAAMAALAATEGVPPPAAALRGAACLLRAGDGAVMVQDVWSRRWALPGGSRHQGESGAVAAERAFREQVGLRATAGRELLRTAEGLDIYACALAQDAVPLPCRRTSSAAG